MKLEFSQSMFEKSSNIKFHENPSGNSRVVPRGRTDMTKLKVVFRNFANATKPAYLLCVLSASSTKILTFDLWLLVTR